MRSKMGRKSCWPVECLNAALDSTFDCLQLRRELLSTGGEGGDGRLCAFNIILGECVILLVIIYFIILE